MPLAISITFLLNEIKPFSCRLKKENIVRENFNVIASCLFCFKKMIEDYEAFK